MRRVLVTGARGYLGRHCLPELLGRAAEVHAVSSRATPADGRATWHQADLLDPQQADALLARVRPTHLLHLAWVATPPAYWTAMENFAWVQASLALLASFHRHGGERLVVAGSCAEYDWRHGYCVEELTPLRPTTVYGTCKHALHLLAARFAEQVGLSAAWGRVFYTYGPHDHPSRLVGSVVLALLRGQHATCSHGQQVRDFLYAADVGSALVALLASEAQGAVNVAAGQPVTIRTVVERIGAQLGRGELIQLGARRSPPDDPPLLVADVRRLRDEVGWRPRYDLDTGLAATIAWWRERLSEGGEEQQCG